MMDESQETQRISKRRIAFFVAMGAVFLLSLWLRMDSLDWGLPFRLHPDEWKYVSAGANCHQGEWNPKYFRNPPGFSYLNALWYPLWLKVRPPVEVPDWLGIDAKWLNPNDDVHATFLYRPFDLVLGGRFLSALLGALTCVAVYFLAREWMRGEYALGAMLLAAVSFANVRESHFAVNDAAATCIVTWVMVLGFRAYRMGGIRWLYSAAALSGVAVAFKYNMAPAVVALMGLRSMRFWENKPNDRVSWTLRDIVVIGLLAVVCFLIVCPFPILDSSTFGKEMVRLREASLKPWQGQDTRWAGLQLAEALWISEGELTTVLALLGLCLSITRRKWALLVFPILYGLLVITHRLFFVRFSLPLLPWISVLTAFAVATGIEQLKGNRALAWSVAGGIFVLGAIEPLLKDLRSNELLQQTDTRIEFVRWLRTEEPSKEFVAVDQFAVPLMYRGVAECWEIPPDPRIVFIDYLPSNELEQLHSLNAPVKWIAVSDFVTLPGHIPDSYDERRTSLKDFFGGKDAMRTFQPFISEWAPKSLDAEDTYSPFRNLWDRDRPGAVIELFARPAENP